MLFKVKATLSILALSHMDKKKEKSMEILKEFLSTTQHINNMKVKFNKYYAKIVFIQKILKG